MVTLCACNAEGTGSIPGWRTKILHAMQSKKKKKQQQPHTTHSLPKHYICCNWLTTQDLSPFINLSDGSFINTYCLPACSKRARTQAAHVVSEPGSWGHRAECVRGGASYTISLSASIFSAWKMGAVLVAPA